jgi:hypothetical protein
MTSNLPAVQESDDALIFARQWIADIRASDFNEWGVSPFDASGGAVLVNRLMRILLDGDTYQALLVLDLARAGWWPADRAIRDANAERVRQGLPPVPLLTEFAVRHLDGEPPPAMSQGKSKIPNLLADLALCTLIMMLCEQFKLKPTRGACSRRRPSACSIAARAAGEAGLQRGGESSLNKVWKRYARALTPGWLALKPL